MSDPSLSDAITEIEVAKMTPAERRRYQAEQIDQILEMFSDYPDQAMFEAALRGFETENSKLRHLKDLSAPWPHI